MRGRSLGVVACGVAWVLVVGAGATRAQTDSPSRGDGFKANPVRINPLVPPAVRPADRLGVFARIMGQGRRDGARWTEAVAEQIGRLAKGRRGPGAEKKSASGSPFPVPRWVPEKMEEKYCFKIDSRTPILPPVHAGSPPPACEEPPEEARILRCLPPLPGVPHCCQVLREDCQIVTERLVDRVDPPYFFQVVGPARLHHCQWKCTVHYTETVESSYPFPCRCRRPRIQVVYIDTDHLHLCPADAPEVRTPPRR
jgi:hypothetical protein